jgi:hypothetical protein
LQKYGYRDDFPRIALLKIIKLRNEKLKNISQNSLLFYIQKENVFKILDSRWVYTVNLNLEFQSEQFIHCYSENEKLNYFEEISDFLFFAISDHEAIIFKGVGQFTFTFCYVDLSKEDEYKLKGFQFGEFNNLDNPNYSIWRI